MKRLFFLFSLTCLLLASCINVQDGESQQKGSSGKTLELLFVADKNVYMGDTKALADSIFRAPQVGLPQDEPLFDMVNIPVSSFKNTEMFQVHRNVVLCDVNPQNPNKVYKYIDQWSAPQIVFEFAVSSVDTLNAFLRRYAPQIIDEIYNAEHRRMYKVFKASENIEIREAMNRQLGIAMTFSNEFELAHPNNPTEDFMWIRKETKDFGIGVFVQAVPYKSQQMFEQSQILDSLDSIMARHIPSSAPDSYMATERRLEFFSHKVNFATSPYCVETRGCWRSIGDFMGGPFVTYTFLSPDEKMLFYATGYVYYPSGRLKNVTKRDLLMQVEGICHSVAFK